MNRRPRSSRGYIPRAPLLFDDGPVLDNSSNPRNACPMRGSHVEEAEIYVIIIPNFLELGRAVVWDENEVDLSI
jgi:hypothetical protein